MASLTPDTLTRSSLSQNPVRAPVYADANGAIVDPTGMTAYMAFIPVGQDPVAGDWLPATWDVSDVYKVQCTPPLLAKGVWAIWVKIVGPDTPIRRVGYLKLV